MKYLIISLTLTNWTLLKIFFGKENRNYLILILGIISVTVGGYFYYSNRLDSYVDVVDMKIESDKIEDFVQFDWEDMKEIVSMDSDKEIVVRLIYSNKDAISSKIKNFDLKFKLTESSFEKDVAVIEHSLQKLTTVTFE